MNKIKIFIMIVLLNLFLTISVHAKPITLNIKDMNLHDAIMLIANIGNLNVSFNYDNKSDKSDKITISINEIEAIEALKIIAKTKNLKLVEENGIFILTNDLDNIALMSTYFLPVRYGDIEELRKAVVLSLDSRINELTNTAERISQSVRVSGADPYITTQLYETISKLIDYSERDPNNKRVMINKDTNSLYLYGTATEYERAKSLLKVLDVPLKQVSLEAKVLAINKDAAKNLGVEWSWSMFPQYPDYVPATTTTTDNGTTTTNTEGYYERHQNDSTGYGIIHFGHMPYSRIPYEWYYGAKINALISNGKAKMLSRPNITTIQGREAIIDIGNRVPVATISTTNSTTTTSYEYVDAGIILRCEPYINEDNTLTVKVYTEVSTPQYVSAIGAYSFNTRSATTRVILKDGEPMVIGGLIGKEEEKSISKIPFLGDLPILGALFRNHHKSSSESELMIFLTAHVIDR